VTRSWIRVARPLFCVVGAIFLLLAFGRTWREVHERVLPSVASLSAGGAALAIALGCAASGWAALFERAELRRVLAYSFVASQLGKYIPGGIWQFVGQVGLASDAGVTIARSSVIVPVHIVVQIAAAGSVGALACVLAPSAPLVWRFVAIAGAGSLALLDRRLLRFVARRIARGLGIRLDGDGGLPSQPAIWRAYLWTSGTLLASGAAFAIMLSSVDASSHSAPIAIFALAWLAGFLAVLVPAGLGVREAVLMAFLPASGGTIVAVSLSHRILTMIVEGAVIAFARPGPR
jgi:glycosyltransferase 2 family protein